MQLLVHQTVRTIFYFFYPDKADMGSPGKQIVWKAFHFLILIKLIRKKQRENKKTENIRFLNPNKTDMEILSNQTVRKIFHF